MLGTLVNDFSIYTSIWIVPMRDHAGQILEKDQYSAAMTCGKRIMKKMKEARSGMIVKSTLIGAEILGPTEVRNKYVEVNNSFFYQLWT